MPPRLRLAPDDRRLVILRSGAEAFAARPYAAVRIEEVAVAAQCSRALLYHYFPNKRALLLAVAEQAMDEISAATRPDPALPPDRRLRAGLDGYFGWAADHRDYYRTLYRGTLVDDELRAITEAAWAGQRERVKETLPRTLSASPGLDVALRGWNAYVTQTCLAWLDHGQDVPRSHLIDLCAGTLGSAISTAAGWLATD